MCTPCAHLDIPGQEVCLVLLSPAHNWSSVGMEAPGCFLHSFLVSTGTVTACRMVEWGEESWTPSLPHPVTVARVPGDRDREEGGRQMEEIADEGFT